MLRLVNRWRYLPKKKRIAAVEVSGRETIVATRRPGDRLVLLPNHPTHADAPILVEALRQIGLSAQIMVAYDVFLRSQLDAWVMQRLGAFSVDREGSDQRAMKQALATLAAGRHALTIFPEGNVYLMNDRVAPFHDGAAFLALKAARQLAVEGHRILAVPVSIKVTHCTDVRPQLAEMLQQLGQTLAAPIKSDQSPLEGLRQVGMAALRRNLAQRGIAAAQGQSLPELIEHAAGSVLARLEEKIELTSRPTDSLIDRVRAARRVIHEVRTDEDRAIDQTAATIWADEAMLAFRIASYSGQYVAARPTIDRFSETLEKLAEDLYGRMMDPFAPRHAFVRFNEPIELGPYLDRSDKKIRAAVRNLTPNIEQAVQRELDELNEQNRYPGAMLWEGPLPG